MESSDSETDFHGFSRDDIIRAAADHCRRMDNANVWSDISLSDYDSEPDSDFDSDDDLPLLPPAVAAMQWRQLGFTPVIRQPFSGPAPGGHYDSGRKCDGTWFLQLVCAACHYIIICQRNKRLCRSQTETKWPGSELDQCDLLWNVRISGTTSFHVSVRTAHTGYVLVKRLYVWEYFCRPGHEERLLW